jgi:hypothetical protein
MKWRVKSERNNPIAYITKGNNNITIEYDEVSDCWNVVGKVNEYKVDWYIEGKNFLIDDIINKLEKLCTIK